MRRFLAPVAGVLLLSVALTLSGTAHRVQASVWWCWDDPVVHLNGRVIHVRVGVPAPFLEAVSVAEIVLTVPSDAEVKVNPVPSPRFTQTATIVRTAAAGPAGANTVAVTLTVRGQGTFDVGLQVEQPGGQAVEVYGRSNQPVSASFTVQTGTQRATGK
jgi:hypothetical protein